MDLTMTQLLLARLYTDTALRQRFLSDPEAVGREFGLDREQTSQFDRLSGRQVSFFAESLIRKRLGEVRKLLPLTRKVLGKEFDALFHQYAERHRLVMPKPHQNDATAFCAFLEKAAGMDVVKNPWALDLARFETACQEANIIAGPCCIVLLFQYSVRELARSMEEASAISVPAPRHTLVVWLRFSRQGRLRFFTFSLPTLSWPGCRRATTQPVTKNAPTGAGEEISKCTS